MLGQKEFAHAEDQNSAVRGQTRNVWPRGMFPRDELDVTAGSARARGASACNVLVMSDRRNHVQMYSKNDFAPVRIYLQSSLLVIFHQVVLNYRHGGAGGGGDLCAYMNLS